VRHTATLKARCRRQERGDRGSAVCCNMYCFLCSVISFYAQAAFRCSLQSRVTEHFVFVADPNSDHVSMYRLLSEQETARLHRAGLGVVLHRKLYRETAATQNAKEYSRIRRCVDPLLDEIKIQHPNLCLSCSFAEPAAPLFVLVRSDTEKHLPAHDIPLSPNSGCTSNTGKSSETQSKKLQNAGLTAIQEGDDASEAPWGLVGSLAKSATRPGPSSHISLLRSPRSSAILTSMPFLRLVFLQGASGALVETAGRTPCLQLIMRSHSPGDILGRVRWIKRRGEQQGRKPNEMPDPERNFHSRLPRHRFNIRKLCGFLCNKSGQRIHPLWART
jgi:hypothetical protein